MNLKLRHIEVFHAVMEEGSVTKAAYRLNLSQPAVSIALTSLEEHIGYSLFHRAKGHFSPRPEAFKLAADAEMSVMAVERFENRAALIGKGGEGYIRVGSFGGPAFSVLPGYMSQFAEGNPLVGVDLQVRSSSQIAHLVRNGQLDLGLIEAPVAAGGIKAEEFESPCVCIMRQDAALTCKSIIEPRDLVGQRLIGIESANQVERTLVKVCAQAGSEVQISMRGYFFAVVRRMVAQGGGIAIVDAFNGLEDLGDGIVARPFSPQVFHRLALITNADASLSLPAQCFAKGLADVLAHGCERMLPGISKSKL